MRCCVDRGNKKPPPPNNDLATSESRPETSTKRAQTPRTTKSTTTATTTTTRARPAVASDKQDKFGDYEYVDSASDGNILTSDSAKKCPGVCVAERLSGFCEAILDVPGICSSNMKC